MFAYLFSRAYPVFFPVSFFCIISISFFFRIKFHHFSVPDRTITRCLRKISFVFPSVSSAVVSCFCTKLSGICTKQNIFCTKTGGNSGMFFQHFRDFLFGSRTFLLFSFDFFGGRVRFSHLPIRFLRVFFYFVGYDSLVSFPSVCLFLRILLLKNLFFQNEPSFRKCIFSLFVWIFSYFFGCSGRFFCPASHPFLHFFRPLAKNNLLFFHPDHPFSEIFSLRRNNFSCLFYVELRKFSVCFHNFFAFSELFQKKNLLFFVSVIGFSGMSFLTIRIFFKFFSWGN